MSIFLSVITPTYNRRHTLHRVWESLNRQRQDNFEWIVIDDGSTDGTEGLLNDWKANARFHVHYSQIGRMGRNAAVNVGRTKISGQFVTLMDSDDAFLDNAFEKIAQNVQEHLSDSSPAHGIAFPYHDEKGNRVCAEFPAEVLQCSHLEARFAHRIRGELLTVYRRNAYDNVQHIELPLPDHLPPSLAHIRLNHTFVYIDTALSCKFRHDGEDRITSDRRRVKKNSVNLKSPRVRYIKSVESLNYCIDYFFSNPGLFWKNAMDLIALGLYFGIPISDQFRDMASWKVRMLCALAFPAGIAKFPILFFRHGRTDRKWNPRLAINF